MFRLIFVALFLIATIAFVESENIDIDWSKVQPLGEYPEFWRDKAAPRSKRSPARREYQSIDQHITNGNVAGRHDFPFKAALISEMSYGSALCGGSLISRWSVLTSAHCIFGSTSTIVILGASDISDPSEPRQVRFRVQSSNYRIHPNFVNGIFRNDVAIVRFHYSIYSFTYAVSPINLPTGTELQELFEGEIVHIMGFGRYSDTSESFTYQLSTASDVTIPSLLCRLMYFSIVDSSHICTLGLLGNICSGDEGSPLVISRIPGQYIQIGVASFHSPDGCEASIPSVHSRITTFSAWIQANM